MTRICENFVDELTSSSGQLSPELREHLVTCPECKLAVESLRCLKAQRRPLAGKEAASIAGILKAVTADAASTASASAAGKLQFGASMPKYMLIMLVAAAVITSYSLHLFVKAQHDEQQQKPLSEQSDKPSALPDNSENFSLPENPANKLPPVNAEELSINTISDNINVVATASQNPDEATASEASKVIMVSPDQEDIRP